MKKTINQLKKEYEVICNEYIEMFCKKQDMIFYGWVGDAIGEVACIGDYFFNFSDITLDINTKQKKDFIFDWYNDNLDKALIIGCDYKFINYASYIKGLRLKDIN